MTVKSDQLSHRSKSMKRHVPNAVGKPFSESTDGLKSAFTIAAFEWSDAMRLRSEAISRGKKQKRFADATIYTAMRKRKTAWI